MFACAQRIHLNCLLDGDALNPELPLMTRRARSPRGHTIAAYWDAWEEQVYRRFSATTRALEDGDPMLLVDHGPVPEVPETAADVPPW